MKLITTIILLTASSAALCGEYPLVSFSPENHTEARGGDGGSGEAWADADSEARGGDGGNGEAWADSDAEARGGNADSYSAGGDSDAEARGGNADSYSAGGDSDAEARGGHSEVYSDGSEASAAGGNARQAQNLLSEQTTNASSANDLNTQISGGGSTGNATSFLSQYESLSLRLPEATAAPAVGGHECLEHLAGWNPLNLGGRTGKTRFNDECLELVEGNQSHQHCLHLVDVYAQLGRRDLALQQMMSCGGVEFTAPGPEYATVDQLIRAFEDSMTK